MNKSRRDRLSQIHQVIEEQKAALEEIKEEEEESLENILESLQLSEKAVLMQGYIDTMEEAMDELDSVLEKILEVSQ